MGHRSVAGCSLLLIGAAITLYSHAVDARITQDIHEGCELAARPPFGLPQRTHDAAAPGLMDAPGVKCRRLRRLSQRREDGSSDRRIALADTPSSCQVHILLSSLDVTSFSAEVRQLHAACGVPSANLQPASTAAVLLAINWVHHKHLPPGGHALPPSCTEL
jgi:hypothetical protein